MAKNAPLNAVQEQFRKDCVLMFNGHQYHTDLNSIAYAKLGQPIDMQGFPTPVPQSELPKLVFKLEEQYALARKNFIQGMSNLQVSELRKAA